MPLRGQYEDSALALTSEDKPNEYLAKDLNAQIRKIKGKMKLPVMAPLAGLGLRKDENSPHDLAFNLGEDAEVISAPILNRDGRFNSSDIDTKIGLPIKLRNKGERGHYKITSGLSIFVLGYFLDLYSRYRDGGLAYSSRLGRVVLKSGGASGAA